VLHVPSEYDYRYSSPRKQEVVTVVSGERKKLLKTKGAGCKVRETQALLLKEFCVTRLEAQKRRAERTAGDPSSAAAGGGDGASSGAGGAKSPVAPGHKLSVVDEDDEDEDVEEVDVDAAAASRAKEAVESHRIDPKLAADEAKAEGADARGRSETVGWATKETPVTLEDF